MLTGVEARRQQFYGPDDALLAADGLRLDGLALLVTGMLELPAALERVLKVIGERMPVELFLPDIPAAVDTPLAKLRARLEAEGAPAAPADGEGATSTALTIMRERLFTAPSTAIEPDGTVRAVSAPDPAREVRAAARACLAWARAGAPFWEMAIAYRHGDE